MSDKTHPDEREAQLTALRGRLPLGQQTALQPRATEILSAVTVAAGTATVIFQRRYGRAEHRGVRAVVLSVLDGTASIVAHQFKPDPGAVIPPDMRNAPGVVAVPDLPRTGTPARRPISDYDPVQRCAEKRGADRLPLGAQNHNPGIRATTVQVLNRSDHLVFATCQTIDDAVQIVTAVGTERVEVWSHRAGERGYLDYNHLGLDYLQRKAKATS